MSTLAASVSPRAGTPQAIVLIAAPLFALMGAVLIAPLLATIQASFRSTPNADVLVPLLLTAPALLLAILSPVAGLLGDREDPRRVLFWSMALYGVAGMAPIFLPSLHEILVSRFLVGAAEAGIVTSAMSLLSSYFSGDERQKWLAYQNAYLPWAAAIIVTIAGVVGNSNWRLTFGMYGLSFVALIAGMRFLVDSRPAQQAPRSSGNAPRVPAAALPWSAILLIGSIAIPGSIAFYLAPPELTYLLERLGVTTPSTSANIMAVGLMLGPAGAFMSRKLTHQSVGTVLALAMTLMSAGLILMALARTVTMVTLGLVIQQIGGGLMFVTGMTYVLNLAGPGERGLYSGVWWFFYILAQFVTPLVMIALMQFTGGRTPSIIVAGVLIASTSIWLVLASALRRTVVQTNAAAYGH